MRLSWQSYICVMLALYAVSITAVTLLSWACGCKVVWPGNFLVTIMWIIQTIMFWPH